jgi:hypothetical protein
MQLFNEETRTISLLTTWSYGPPKIGIFFFSSKCQADRLQYLESKLTGYLLLHCSSLPSPLLSSSLFSSPLLSSPLLSSPLLSSPIVLLSYPLISFLLSNLT